MSQSTSGAYDGPEDFSMNIKEQAAIIAARLDTDPGEEWMRYIHFLIPRIDIAEGSKRNKMISFMYRTAIKSIPESCKSLAKAKLISEYMRLDPKDADMILAVGRRTLRQHSIIHICSAEVELKKGKKDKALRILQQALAIGSQPSCDIQQLMEAIGRDTSTGSGCSPDSGRDSSGEVTTSQLTGDFELSSSVPRHAIPPRINTQEFQHHLAALSLAQHTQPKQSTVQDDSLLPHDKLARGSYTGSHTDSSLQSGSQLGQDLAFLKPPSPPKLLTMMHTEDPSDNRSQEILRNSSSTGALLTNDQLVSHHNEAATPDLHDSHDPHDPGSDHQRFGRYNSFSGIGGSSVKNSARKKPLLLGKPRRVPKRLVEEQEDAGDVTMSAFPVLDPPHPKAATIDLDTALSHEKWMDAEADVSIRKDIDKENVGPLPDPSPYPADINMDSPAKQKVRPQPTPWAPVAPVAPPPAPASHEVPAQPQAQPQVLKPVDSFNTPAKMCGSTYAVHPGNHGPVAAAPGTHTKKQQKTKEVNGKTYTVIKLAGRGGSAKVFQVLDLEGEVCGMKALKIVDLSGVNQCILDGYMNEIQLLQKLAECDRVIRLYDWEYCAASHKLLMLLEYGETDLDHYMSRRVAPFTQPDPPCAPHTPHTSLFTVGHFWLQMVEAVAAMHREGVIHSDLKPANFLLVSGEVKLIDFGIAKALQEDKTSMLKDTVVGTPSYMSPEMLVATREEAQGPRPRYKVGVRGDVWSLGCILYRMVYGRTPFQHLRNKIEAIINPRHAIQFPPGPSPELLDILHQCLTRDVAQRPTTHQLLAHPYLNSQPRG